MRREADGEGPAAEAAKKRYDDALKSLGFRPRGAELKGGGVSGDKPQTLRDAGRHAPPPEWAEQYREYSRGLADPDRK